MQTSPPVSRLLLSVRDPQKIADFYVQHFAFLQKPRAPDGLIEVVSTTGAFSLLLHPASKGHRTGQSCVKIVFDVQDIGAFKIESEKKGLKFGVTFQGEGYEFANARDPAKNPIQISSRAFLK